MFNLQNLTERILSKRENTEKQLIEQIAFMMMELNVSYDDLMDMPIPAFIILQEALGNIKKHETKTIKKANRRK